jgi:hypothetical protein
MKTLLWAMLIAEVLVLLVMAGYSATSSNVKHGNSLGVVQYADRPVQYLEASIVGGSVHVEGKQELTTVRFQPTGTYALFTEDWTFCGNRADLINGKTGVIVLSFSTVQHHRDCYDLYSVHKVQEEPMQ